MSVFFVFAAILLGHLRLPIADIKAEILRMSTDKFSQSHLEQMALYAPDQHEVKHLSLKIGFCTFKTNHPAGPSQYVERRTTSLMKESGPGCTQASLFHAVVSAKPLSYRELFLVFISWKFYIITIWYWSFLHLQIEKLQKYSNKVSQLTMPDKFAYEVCHVIRPVIFRILPDLFIFLFFIFFTYTNLPLPQNVIGRREVATKERKWYVQTSSFLFVVMWRVCNSEKKK